MTPEGNELYRATLSALDKRPSSAAPEWLVHRRQQAKQIFSDYGFPTAKDEAWRFTPLRPILRVPFETSPVSANGREAVLRDVADLGSPRIVLVNGKPDIAEAPRTTGIRIYRISELLDREPALIEPHLCRLARDGGFVAQNAASFEDGLVIVATARSDPQALLHLVYAAVSSGAPTVSYPRVVVIVENGAELRLVETHVSSADEPVLENGVSEISLGENARMEHIRIHHGRADAHSVSSIAVQQQRDSHYASRVFTFGGALCRVDLAVRLQGRGAECELDGLYYSSTDEQVDHHTFIEHESSFATSREKYKGILDGSGKAIFDGIIVVRHGAEKTKAHQENRNLLLSGDAIVHTKPHLEIDADDVQCSHGSTVGRLDANQLFYLRTRGIPLAAARAALTYSFAREMVDRIAEGVIARHLAEVLSRRLPDSGLAGEIV